MAWSISEDLRCRVVEAYRKGDVTYEQIAKRFGVGRASVSRWLRLERESGSVAAKQHRGGRALLVSEAAGKGFAGLGPAKPGLDRK